MKRANPPDHHGWNEGTLASGRSKSWCVTRTLQNLDECQPTRLPGLSSSREIFTSTIRLQGRRMASRNEPNWLRSRPKLAERTQRHLRAKSLKRGGLSTISTRSDATRGPLHRRGPEIGEAGPARAICTWSTSARVGDPDRPSLRRQDFPMNPPVRRRDRAPDLRRRGPQGPARNEPNLVRNRPKFAERTQVDLQFKLTARKDLGQILRAWQVASPGGRRTRSLPPRPRRGPAAEFGGSGLRGDCDPGEMEYARHSARIPETAERPDADTNHENRDEPAPVDRPRRPRA